MSLQAFCSINNCCIIIDEINHYLVEIKFIEIYRKKH